ncbi:autotransporter outer membrane beta-barrel domain-containing protein [Psittacicella hinzii]|uniref:Autotransporter domain-containing protein n=1 Tax=Psittacicella hinzii TaxID=2028575 RepID=A0A3A1YH78_9GAMM|nr:autotransporter outer membrane beta-barrel domain-containing protein [Psittacicella hinzii]RIY36816.1 hypothetical protein CKF58_05585 [Psittacicella hinzii]
MYKPKLTRLSTTLISVLVAAGLAACNSNDTGSTDQFYSQFTNTAVTQPLETPSTETPSDGSTSNTQGDVAQQPSTPPSTPATDPAEPSDSGQTDDTATGGDNSQNGNKQQPSGEGNTGAVTDNAGGEQQTDTDQNNGQVGSTPSTGDSQLGGTGVQTGGQGDTGGQAGNTEQPNPPKVEGDSDVKQDPPAPEPALPPKEDEQKTEAPAAEEKEEAKDAQTQASTAQDAGKETEDQSQSATTSAPGQTESSQKESTQTSSSPEKVEEEKTEEQPTAVSEEGKKEDSTPEAGKIEGKEAGDVTTGKLDSAAPVTDSETGKAKNGGESSTSQATEATVDQGTEQKAPEKGSEESSELTSEVAKAQAEAAQAEAAQAEAAQAEAAQADEALDQVNVAKVDDVKPAADTAPAYRQQDPAPGAVASQAVTMSATEGESSEETTVVTSGSDNGATTATDSGTAASTTNETETTSESGTGTATGTTTDAQASAATTDENNAGTDSNTTSSASTTPATENTESESTESSDTTIAAENTTTTDDTQAETDEEAQAAEEAFAATVTGLAGTAYSNMQLAATNTARSSALDFTKAAMGRYLTDDTRVYAYVNFNGKDVSWKHSNKLIKGDLNQFGTTAGFYTQRNGWNFGAAATIDSSNWKEKVAGDNDYINKEPFAKGDIKTVGLTFAAGLAGKDYWVSGTFFGFSHRTDVERSSLRVYDQKAKLKGTTLGLGVQAGFKVLETENVGVEVNGGLTAQTYKQKAFAETAQNDDAKPYSLEFKAKTHNDFFANVGVRSWYKFSSFGFDSELDAGLNLYQSLTKNRFDLVTKDNVALKSGFSHKFLADLNLGYTINLSKNFSVKLGTSFAKASNYSALSGNLNFKLSF